MKTVEVKAKRGIRNDLSLERFDNGDLSVGTNVEIDDTGKVYRRLPTQRVLPGIAHSLWGDSRGAFAVVDEQLGFFDGTTHHPLAPVIGERVAYVRIAGDVYWTDGITSGVIRDGVNYPDGIAVPEGMAARVVPGAMREGRYLYTMTYVRAGRESGAHEVRAIDIPPNSGVEFMLPLSPDSAVTEKRVYVSAWNGAVPYLVAVVGASESLCTVSELPASQSVPVRTLQMGRLPPGQLLGYFAGRRYVAQNNYLWYSLPYEYELCDLTSSFIGFDAPVKTFAALSDGIFVGSDTETVFLQGTDPEAFVRRKVADYGTVLGTEKEVPGYYVGKDNDAVVHTWMSKHGVCAGMDSGQFKNLTGRRFILPEGVSSGASLLKVRGGTPQLVTSLFD